MRGFERMTLANMRLNGVRSVSATCANCGRSTDVNVDLLPETLIVPEVGKRLRCSHCGGETISTRPAWHTSPRQSVRDYRANDPQCPRPLRLSEAVSGSSSWRTHKERSIRSKTLRSN